MRRIRLEKGCVQAEQRRVPFVWRLSAGFAMAACLAVLVHGAITVQAHRQHVAELRVERQKLEAELQAVKKIASEAEPLLVLEHEDGTRVIMDLDSVQPRSGIQPASYRTFD
jgi:hypothetical protein